mmetsp:Transcript_768/g.749  ORF Transcript_768/g.749 Transcript_768/m.749 type:complete len:814 (+) Transcript_768:205-2646(+)
MASISVPIEKHKQSLYSKDPFGNSHQSGGYGGHSYNRLSGLHDNGPPYIVKLLNLPITSNEAFIEDLFKSRYTAFVKFKIVVDPSSNILETHVIKKVAFVELESFQEMNKVLKWQDLFYKATRRVVVELADFHDFQHCIAFNQEHEREIQQIQDDFIKQKQSQHFGHGGFDHGPRNININSPPRKHQPLNSHATPMLQPSLSGRKSSIPQEGSAAPLAAAPPRNKPNPFGAAKPVDVLAKQHEIDKKLITINHTTIKTLGPMADDIDHHDLTEKHTSLELPNVPHEGRQSQKESRRASVNILKRPSPSTNQSVPINELHPEPKETEKSQLTKAPIPESIYAPKDNSKSLAELLSKNENPSPPKGRSTPKSIKNSPKPSTNKPVILKKKTQTPAVDLTIKESKFASNAENTVESIKVQNELKDKEIEDKLKEINDSLSEKNKLENILKPPVNGSGKSKGITSDQNRSHEVYNKAEKAPSIPDPQENKKSMEAQVPLSQEAERAKDRPNFKKHFAELSKRQNIQREKVQTSQSTRFNSHSQTFSNRKNGVNHKHHSPKESSFEKATVTSNQNTADSKNTTPKNNVNGDAKKEDRGLGAKASGRNKSRFSGRERSIELPKKEVKKIEEVKARRLQANLRNNNRSGKRTKETNNTDKIGPQNGFRNMNDAKDLNEKKDVEGVQDVKGMKDVKDAKETKETKPEISSKNLNSTTVNEKNSKTPEVTEKEVKSDPINGLTSSSTGGKQSISDSVNSKTDTTKSDVLSEASITSSRGRGGRGRCRGRGGFRGSVRGLRGTRGRGNFNLHYVRSKDDKNES